MDNMQLWLSSSTDSINLNDSAEGFYLNPDLEGLTGLPEIRSVNGLNAGYDGGWTATQLWAARLITIRGVIAINDKAAVETKRKALAKLLAQGKSEDLELRFVSEAGNTYTTTVRTTGCTMALQRVFWRQEYQIQLRANDPLIYDDGGSELVAILRVMAGEGGFEIPFDIPFTIGGSIEPTSVDVGDEATYPLIRLKGDLHNPTIISMTTNQRMQVLADIIATVEWRDYTTTYTTNGFAQINDGIDGAPLSLTHLYGNATQETLSGKNILNINGTIDTQNASVSISGDSITITSTANAEPSRASIIFSYDANREMTISFDAEVIENNATDTINNVVFRTIGASDTISVASLSNTVGLKQHFVKAITSDNNTRSLWIYIKAQNNAGVRSVKFSNIQVEYGSTATAYEPYVGGVPSPNPNYPQEVKTVSGLQTVKITGKNLIDVDNATWVSSNSTLTEDSGVFEMAAQSGKIARIALPIPRLVAGMTYVISFEARATSVSSINTYARLRELSNSGTWLGDSVAITVSDLFSKKTITYTPTTITEPYLWFYLSPNASNTNNVDIFVKNIQLELGNQATTYEPYQSQSQEINLGKNLLHLANYTAGGVSTTLNSDGTITVSGTTANNYANFMAYQTPMSAPSGTYTFSRTGDNTYRASLTIFNRDKTQNTSINIPAGSNSATAVIPFDIGYVAGAFTNLTVGSNLNFTTGLQLELGSQASSFSPYKTPLELAKIGTYQDYIWNDGGTWKIHKAIHKVVLDGYTETEWSIRNTGTDRYYYRLRYLSDVHYMADGSEWISDRLSLGIVGETTTDEGCFIISGGELRIRYGTEMSLTDWKDYLKDHNITLYYQAETPTDTEITDSELIEQLNHIYELYQGTNNLWLIPSAGAQGEMEVSYASVKDVDYHEVVIDCQARTVTQDGHNLYPALAEGSEFIRLLPGENKLYLTSEVESDNGTAEVKFKKGNISI